MVSGATRERVDLRVVVVLAALVALCDHEGCERHGFSLSGGRTVVADAPTAAVEPTVAVVPLVVMMHPRVPVVVDAHAVYSAGV
jgi:hypothetical protein